MQDAHEFLNFMLNDMAETLERTEKERRKRGQPGSGYPLSGGGHASAAGLQPRKSPLRGQSSAATQNGFAHQIGG